MQGVFERYCSAIKKLSRLDYSENQITEDTEYKHGMVNVLDYSESRGGKSSKLTIIVEFANLIDLSEVEIDHLIIRGRANIVDLSESTIKKLDRRRLEAVHIDFSESTIEEDIYK